MLSTHLFQAQEYPLSIYNGKPIINIGIGFYYYDDTCVTDTESAFDFDGYVSSYLRIYNERLGRIIKTIPLDRSSNILMINSTDTDFDDNGKYYYEIGYVQSGGYELLLRYGILIVL